MKPKGAWLRPPVWQSGACNAGTIPEGDPRLKLNGITFGVATPLAVIHGKTLAEGESVKLAVKPGVLTVECLKIQKDSVLVSIEGEDRPRLLRLE